MVKVYKSKVTVFTGGIHNFERVVLDTDRLTDGCEDADIIITFYHWNSKKGSDESEFFSEVTNLA